MRLSGSDRQAGSWIFLGLVALALFVGAALLLPNPEQDAYSYVEIIRGLSGNIANADLRPADLFGFWLPFYPLLSASIDAAARQPLLVGKIVSAMFGAASCLLVGLASFRLTNSRALALTAFCAVLTRPLYLLYAAASMTDAPNACLVIAALVFVLYRRWSLAAVCAALAELTRLESWVLILAIPLLQIICERRVSTSTVIILILPPLLWLGISHAATGEWLGYFSKRAVYQQAYLEFFSSRRHFNPDDVTRDVRYFIAGANPIVFVAVLGVTAWTAWRFVRGRVAPEPAIFGLTGCALIGFYVVAYLTKRQPVILPRYAFAIFLAGLPLLAWLVRRIPYGWLILLTTLWTFAGEIGTIKEVVGDDAAQHKIAAELRKAMSSPDDRCFSDNPAVRVLSGLPPNRFVRTETMPKAFTGGANQFEDYLRQNRIRYLIYYRIENSLAVKFFPQQDVEMIASAESPFGPAIALYRRRSAR